MDHSTTHDGTADGSSVETGADARTDTGSGEGAIVLENLRKEFGDLVAVDGIDLAVDPGELLVLIGPSGCGKSTTLRMIAGLEVPTSGRIDLGGEEITETLPQQRDVSMVFQNYALYPHKTVRDNLAFPLGKMDLTADEADARIERVARQLEIEELLDRKPDQLSGGQRQRVAVGRTIVREPAAFLMDEPLSNLDAQLRVQTRAEIRDLQQELETTTIYVTHDQEEAMSIADRLVVMNDGGIEQVGTPRALYERPANEFVASFLGEPSMNFLDVSRESGSPTAFAADPIDLESVLPDREVPDAAARLGIRPEDCYLLEEAVPDHSDPGEPITFDFEFVDPLGHVYELSIGRGGERFVAQSGTRPDVDGDTVEVRFDQHSVHWFDEKGVAL